MLGEKYWGSTVKELVKSRADLSRWASANEASAITFERMGAPVEATMMRNAAIEQNREWVRVDEMIQALRKSNPHCEDCPPAGYATDVTRCDECPRFGFGGE
ncbi:MAG: hypothetical protein OJJ21_16760 [Ferrovibrio sp.]|uniref:hypothetical protein n=1 Tax=Ferrovibrio sp. TaxID=1917215 RepID=UPI00260DE5B0|nr:hypothetical protein [Ferrovibrio sp.]MCW0235254.1 hypothetical protein [Ferrovibrio sp.]